MISFATPQEDFSKPLEMVSTQDSLSCNYYSKSNSSSRSMDAYKLTVPQQNQQHFMDKLKVWFTFLTNHLK